MLFSPEEKKEVDMAFLKVFELMDSLVDSEAKIVGQYVETRFAQCAAEMQTAVKKLADLSRKHEQQKKVK